jgi:hypothetical protein
MGVDWLLAQSHYQLKIGEITLLSFAILLSTSSEGGNPTFFITLTSLLKKKNLLKLTKIRKIFVFFYG